jgi:hypothetical protein
MPMLIFLEKKRTSFTNAQFHEVSSAPTNLAIESISDWRRVQSLADLMEQKIVISAKTRFLEYKYFIIKLVYLTIYYITSVLRYSVNLFTWQRLEEGL